MKLTLKFFASKILILYILFPTADAKPNDGLKCTIEGITDNCQFFSKNPNREITFEDGSMVPNYFAGYGLATMPPPIEIAISKPDDKGEATTGTSDTTGTTDTEDTGDVGTPKESDEEEKPFTPMFDSKKADNLRKTNLIAQASIISDPELKGSDLFKLTLSDPITLYTLGLEQSSGFKPLPILIPWPPESENFQKVSIEELNKYIENLPSKKTKENLKSQIKKVSLAYQETNFGGQYSKGKYTADTTPKKLHHHDGPPSYESCLANGANSCADVSDKRMEQIMLLAEKTRSYLVEEIKAGKRDEDLTPEQIFMIEKVKSVKLFNIDQACMGQFSASYSPTYNDVSICPNSLLLPDLDVIGTFAHELAHSIDPCRILNSVYEINIDKEERVSKTRDLKNLTTNQSIALSYIKILGTKGTRIANIDSTLGEREIKWLLQEGIIKSIAAPKGALKSIPYQAASDCIIKSTKIRQSTEQDKQKSTSDYFRSLENTYGADAKAMIQNLSSSEKARMEKMGTQCFGNSQANEMVSDLWSAKVVGRHLESTRSQLLGKSDALKAFGLYASITCNEKLRNMPDYNIGRAPHPHVRERVEDIYMQDPKIRQAFGCQEAPKNQCLSLLGSPTNESAKPNENIRGVK